MFCNSLSLHAESPGQISRENSSSEQGCCEGGLPEEVYLNASDDIRAAKKSLGHYFEFRNTQRKHQSLRDQTPDRVYYEEGEQ